MAIIDSNVCVRRFMFLRNQRFGGEVERYVGGYTLDVHKKMKFIARGSL
ncbi:hypothetical protein [Rhizobium sullae]|uniref:PIN domain-containing protein n=1 Tax=Rhizobium sullae TaxID=50338 RepID=A0ABY5XZ54_RHISU|nr:hypothetical protein [Rhizobium sullae]UWU19341.1 hypothetical protein N2599_34450 [Rhizobium sullae]